MEIYLNALAGFLVLGLVVYGVFGVYTLLAVTGVILFYLVWALILKYKHKKDWE